MDSKTYVRVIQAASALIEAIEPLDEEALLRLGEQPQEDPLASYFARTAICFVARAVQRRRQMQEAWDENWLKSVRDESGLFEERRDGLNP